MKPILYCFFTYITGSLPTGYLAGKLLKGIDIRQHGSGNSGATNVFRTVGTTAGVITLLIDFLKGYVPVIIALNYMAGTKPYFPIIVGACAIIGHIFTIFLKFRGGKGVATGAGALAALMPLPVIFAALTFLVILAITRYVSLGSMISACALPLFSFIHNEPKSYSITAAAIAAIIIYTHRSNIRNLILKKELKVGKKNV